MASISELSIFIDESGDLGLPAQPHSPWYILSLVLHDQSDDISPQLQRIHHALTSRGLAADHAVHTGPLIRREKDYLRLDMRDRRSIFRVLYDFVTKCAITHYSLVFNKQQYDNTDLLLGRMARELGALVSDNYSYFLAWDRVVIYYDSGQKEIKDLVNAVFNAHLENVEVRKVAPSNYSLFQAADMCCTFALLRKKINTPGVTLSASERDFFATDRASAERALKKNYFKALDRKLFGN